MKVLFAVSNDKMSESIVKQYQKDYKQIITYKNVYYFNAILKELQRDKTYDRIVISEDLEQYVNTDFEQMDNFIFGRLDNISDEASNMNGEDIPIILICTGRRNKSEPILVKLFGIGIYNAIIGNDRSVNEVCRLINRPRSKKEAKIYYKIDSEDVNYEKDDENDVSELEIQNILAHYKRLGNDEEKMVESFDSIASQYNDTQLKVISKCLPLNVRAVLEEKSPKYQQVNAYTTKVSDQIRINKKQAKGGPSEILLKDTNTVQLKEPVVVPSAIDTSKKRKILTKPAQQTQDNIQKMVQPKVEQPKMESVDLEDIELEELPEIKDIPESEYMPEIDISELEEKTVANEPAIEEVKEQPVKRGRGRPRKTVVEPVEQQPKRKRGRPKKVQEPVIEEKSVEEESFLPGVEEVEQENVLPGIEETEENVLPGFGYAEEDVLPEIEEEEEKVLPGFEEEPEASTQHNNYTNYNEPEHEQENVLPGLDNSFEPIQNDNYTNPLNNLRKENELNQNFMAGLPTQEVPEYEELDLERLMVPDQKIVAFVGTSKNGTSFLVNNVAELLSTNGINTAILDLTQNRNAYYIYTKNEEDLRNKSNYIMENLKNGKADGILEHRNLTIYTSPFENGDELQAVEPIVETLVKNHNVILMDCDFDTPIRYFKYAQEIYLVQSMDILTIQPLTAFLRKLLDKGVFNESKARVVLNKFSRTREISEDLLVGGISIYNDAGMTVRKELFNRKTVQRITIPFELKTYLRYLDGLVTCDVSLKGYSKDFMQSLKKLANMIYQGNEKNKKYTPPSVKNNNTFSPSMNSTLEQMKRNY